ncbi:MBL fold metallo-hydrolase [Sphingopyxis sp.]|uniref:MBL fold metallo-hydrolase n=1 Tax=Sphingopyxis sp. TaxID=1908224 RepID=UPI003D6C8989
MLIMLFPAPLCAQELNANVETPTEHSQSQAQMTLKRAADAFGGTDALLAMGAIRVAAKGHSFARFQSPSAAPPFKGALHETDLLLDLRNRRLAFHYTDDQGGVLRRNLTIIGSGEPRIYNLHARSVRPFPAPPSFERELAAHSRRSPHLLIRHALANPLELRSLDSATLAGRAHDVISFPMPDGVQVALFVDRASGLISKFDTLYSDILTGTEAAETLFEDYVGKGLGRYPRTVRLREAGHETLLTDLSVAIDPSSTDQSFAFDATGYLPVGPSQPNPERIEELGKGIHVLHSVSDPQHNALAVEFENYVVVVDAPHSSEGGERLIKKVESLVPGKPIRFVALTHHHDDHMSGLRSFIASGATVITTPGNRGFIEAFAKARHGDRLDAEPRPLRLEMVRNRKLVLSDGKRTLELIDVGPNPHAQEILIAYLPREKIVYQSDLFQIPSNEGPTGPAPSSFAAFAEAIDKLGLQIETIAAGHGRTATIKEFRERMSFRHPPG